MRLGSNRRMIIGSLACLVFLAGAFAALAAGAEDTVRKTFTVRGGGKLALDSDLGSIEVRSHQKAEVRVEVTRKVRSLSRSRREKILKEFQLSFDQEGNTVTIEGDYNRKRFRSLFGRRWSLNVHFEIWVPERFDLDLRTAGGSIRLSDIEGDVKVRTSGGSLKMDQVKGPVFGRTSGGTITLDRAEGDVDVHTSGGSIRIGQVEGDLKAHTSGGSIHAEEVGGAIQAHTSGGSIKVQISRQPDDDCSLRTSGGSITVYLDEEMNFNIDARTSGGRINSDFPITLKGEISRRSMKGKINDGGPELYIRTAGGGIHIKRD